LPTTAPASGLVAEFLWVQEEMGLKSAMLVLLLEASEDFVFVPVGYFFYAMPAVR